MSTVATDEVERLAAEWKKLYKSARLSGILPDEDHLKRGGYHVSREDNPKGNYSIIRPDDKFGPANASAAIDMTMSTADLVLCTNRLAVLYANVQDPRRKYLNGFNGWDGSGDATRYDIYARKTGVANPSHKWHCHLELRRRYVNSRAATDAILSGLRGQSVATYLKSVGVSTPTATTTATVEKVVAPPKWPGKVFSRKDTMKPDTDLKKWQARMVERGWRSIGTPDGVFGPKTESVVKRFQATCKVTVDGEIGKVTWALPWSRPLGS